MNSLLAHRVIQALIHQGIKECCICPGARNAPLIYALTSQSMIKLYYWPEERSAAFFALGRIKAIQQPVAVLTTSGAAVGELLPATMEAHYTSMPLILLTADRPQRFRGSGAPQSAEQIGIFSHYIHFSQDLTVNDMCDFKTWTRQGPLHLNVCFEEPQDQECQTQWGNFLLNIEEIKRPTFPVIYPDSRFDQWIESVKYPLVIVGALHPSQYENVIHFLLQLQAPIYAEGISGIREEPRLNFLRISFIENLWKQTTVHSYPIDGVLRIGGIPTARLWRDIENKEGTIPVCSISTQPFSGLSGREVIHTDLSLFLQQASQTLKSNQYDCQAWIQANQKSYQQLLKVLEEEPLAEMSLVRQLSQLIPPQAKVYLGNSLPIREWDQAAIHEPRQWQMAANRGLNGIDGQFSTFLGYSSEEQSNWAILGDLTALYDLVAPWILQQLPDLSVTCVVINNGGGKIFSRMFAHPAFQHQHAIRFEGWAQLWKWDYEQWTVIPSNFTLKKGGQIIEVIPDPEATARALQKIKEIL